MGIVITQKGNFNRTEKYLSKLKNLTYKKILEKYGQMGVERLREMTPKRTGKTANSWSYEIIEENETLRVVWRNSNVNKYVNIAIILQYGHATRNGGYVTGIDYINPALKPVFEKMAIEAWEEVIKV